MAVDTQQIISEAEKLGQLVAQHPSVSKFRDAAKAVQQDADANRLLREFDRQLETLARQEAGGMPVTDAQRRSLESLQSQIASHLRIKAMHLAQVEFVDLLRKVNQTIQGPLAGDASAAGVRTQSPGPRLV